MQHNAHTYQTYSYPEIFSRYFFHGEDNSIRPCPEYTLIFVFSGELTISRQKIQTTLRKGQYIFLRKDNQTHLTRKISGREPLSSVFMGFTHNFLNEFHRNMKKKAIGKNTGSFPANIIQIPCNPYLESMYVSLLPYLHHNIQPIRQIVEIKLMEAIFSLLLTDEKFYTCLFDFPEAEETHNIQHTTDRYLPNHTECNLSEFSCSDLSTSYFRNKITNQATCLQCKMTKELEAEYIRLHHQNTAVNIYMEAGYKNVARFTRIFDTPYGFTTPN